MSDNIASDLDGVIEEQETPNEYEELPIVDEPDEDEFLGDEQGQQ